MPTKELPSPELLRQLLRYDPESGLLYWRERTPDMFSPGKRRSAQHKCANWNAKHVGKLALNYINAHGHKAGRVLGKHIYAHRAIWAMQTGDWPTEVDHKNHIGSDNRWCNLRSATHSENMKNHKLRSDNTSGHTGVRWEAPRQKWYAVIQSNGKRRHIGVFDSFSEAVKARKRAEAKNGFHKNHGKVSK